MVSKPPTCNTIRIELQQQFVCIHSNKQLQIYTHNL
jgi:hypothetical protein